MKNYKKISLGRISDFGNYVEKKLSNGHIIIGIWLNDDKKEIVKLIGYAEDRNSGGELQYLKEQEVQLQKDVLVETMTPIYHFEKNDKSKGKCYPEIKNVCLERFNSQVIKEDFSWQKEALRNDQKGIYLKSHEGEVYCQYYVSEKQDDFKNFGGPLERIFIKEWMESVPR